MTALTDYSELRGVQKAAILMTVLGDDAAAVFFRNLPEDDLKLITKEIANLGRVPPNTSEQVLREYQQMTASREFVTHGGADTATRLLVKAFGESGAREMQSQMVRTDELNSGRAESLQKADPKQLARLLEGEHPQTVALVLGHLEPKQASALLVHLPRSARAESVRRLANLRQFSPAMAERISAAFHRRLRSAGELNKRTYSGFQNVAQLMNIVDTETSREILENIEGQDPKLAANIRELMFTFEDFMRLDDAQLRELSSSVERSLLAMALKGASPDLRERFFKTMSVRAVELLKEEMEQLGPVRSKDALRAHGEMVSVARQLEEQGKMNLRMDEGDAFV
ncbi:MAG TPA: flagellar motor switch protein FliG [Acidobacteriaceae bacterium]|nr:flagellar motor switch protein FliG [Acidobacteriaceae bacterium]